MAVTKAIQSRRITRGPDGLIDFAEADRQWEENSRVRAPHSTQPPSGAKTPADPAMPDEADPSLPGSSQYLRARAMREYYLARLAQVEYEANDRHTVAEE